MSIHLVDFRRKRHTQNGKDFLSHVCSCITHVEHEVAGFAVVVWDDTGRSSFAFSEGGPISHGAIGSFVQDKIKAAIEITEVV